MYELCIDSVDHRFGNRHVLSQVYLKCAAGEIVGVFGRNGGGKSTLLKAIFGSISPHNKHLRIDGKIIEKGYLSGEVVYLPQSYFIPHYMRVVTLLELYVNKYRAQLLQQEVVRDNLNEKIGHLSGGNRRFVEALLVIYSDARYVLLDEPFSQLSPLMIEKIKANILCMLPHKGFVITDHYYSHMLQFASRMVLLNNGSNYHIDTVDDLKRYGYLPNTSD
jgi:lipopolysaccharide export system ATP-binding protein